MTTSQLPFADLPEAERRALQAWLADFERSWEPDRLALYLSELPPETPGRLWAASEAVKIDLRNQWQSGHKELLESYLQTYPELGTPETVPLALIQAEAESRREAGEAVAWAEYVRRFPRQTKNLQRSLEQLVSASPTLTHSSPEPQSEPATEGPAAEAETVRPSGTAEPVTAPRPSPLIPAEAIGRYNLIRELGRGAMGTVYLAHDMQLDRDVAMKVPHLGDDHAGEAVIRFYREAKAVAKLDHPNICRVHDVGEVDGRPYFTMAYVEGCPLSRYLRDQRPLPQRRAAELIYQLARALEEAHGHGIIHRDLKPSNIMMNQREEPIIMDFGLVRRTDVSEHLTHDGSILGTPAYMPPEQAAGDLANIGPPSDIYSLGVILYELLAGQLPFKGSVTEILAQGLTQTPAPPPSTHRPDLDPKLEKICMKAMAPALAERYGTMKELSDKLAEYLQATAAGKQEPPSAPALVPFVVPPLGGARSQTPSAPALVPFVVPPSGGLRPQPPEGGTTNQTPAGGPRKWVVVVSVVAAVAAIALALLWSLWPLPTVLVEVPEPSKPKDTSVPVQAVAKATPEELAGQAREILKKHCFACHGQNPKKLKGSLNLFDRGHLEDAERKIVVAHKPDDSELVLQVEKGAMPPGKRLPLNPAEKTVLRAWVLAGAPAFARVEAVRADNDAGGPEQAARVKEIFRLHCLECHGGSKIQAGVKILDHHLLVSKRRVVPGRPDDSTVFQLMTATDESAMPPAGQPRLSQEEIDTVRLWIADGAAIFPQDAMAPAEPKREAAFKDVAGVDYVHRQILQHIRQVPTTDRRYKRYFSLNHILTTGATASELQLQRDALAKAINHLSWEPKIVRPMPIDTPSDSVYCIDLRDLGWQQQAFERWVAGKKVGRSELNLFDLALLEYPYGIVYEDSETFDRLKEEFLVPAAQVRPIVYVRSDWFVSVITQPPFYDDFLRLPFEVQELEAKLGVDSAANLRDGLVRRAGMTVSGVSRNNRVVERHPSKDGAYWKSYDFRTNKGMENMFRDPIHLHATGGEMIFSLPNGLQGYFVTTGLGDRIAEAPTEIVTDKFAEDKTVRNGLACMRCHARGLKDFADTVRPALLRLPGSPGFDKRTALDLYPEQAVMDQFLKEDSERFLSAMAKVLGRPQTRTPLVPVARRFLDDPLGLTTAGGELGLVEPTGLQTLFRTPHFTGLGLIPLAAQGVVRRDAWEDYFDQVVSGLGLGVPVVPLDGLSRRHFPSGPAPFEVELKTNKKHNTFEPGDELVVFVTNRTPKPLYVELFGTSARGRMVLLAPSTTTVGSNETYRYPAEGGLKIRGGLGKEQITLYASDAEFPGGELLRGQGVTDRVVHAFYQYQRQDGHWRMALQPGRFVKRTIEIETR